MGNRHKVTQEDESAADIAKKKDQMEFNHKDFIRDIEGDVEEEYQILNPALVANEFYELRKAIHKRTTLCKAIFIINKYKVRSKQRELLQQQIRLLKQLDSPFLLKIYELYHDKHRFYIVCEFCYGQSISEILHEEGSFTERKAATIIYQLLNVLGSCHAKGILHSDLKLENITFNSGEQNVIKVTDFGFSRIFRVEDIVEQSRKKAFLGAPETLNGEPEPKSDIWSCGMILYIMLSGKIPILGASMKKLKQAVMYYEPEFPQEDFAFVSKEAKNMIRRMLRYSPEERPSAEQCLNHPWIKKYYHPVKISNATLKRVLNQCFNFNPSSKLQEATWNFYVNALVSFDEKQSILHVFSMIDRSCAGCITPDDMMRTFEVLYSKKKSEFLTNFIFGRHRWKPINFSQFVAMCTNREFLIDDDNNKKIFRIIDDDSSGEISVSELKAVLGASKQVGQQVWLQLMKQADANSDGMISLDQFSDIMRQMKNTSNQKLIKHLSLSKPIDCFSPDIVMEDNSAVKPQE